MSSPACPRPVWRTVRVDAALGPAVGALVAVLRDALAATVAPAPLAASGRIAP